MISIMVGQLRADIEFRGSICIYMIWTAACLTPIDLSASRIIAKHVMMLYTAVTRLRNLAYRRQMAPPSGTA